MQSVGLAGQLEQVIVEASRVVIGEPLYQCQLPTGYSDKAETWVNTGCAVEPPEFFIGPARQLRSKISHQPTIAVPAFEEPIPSKRSSFGSSSTADACINGVAGTYRVRSCKAVRA